MITRHFIRNKITIIPDNEIWYTSTDGNVVTPYAADVFGANIVSNTYKDGKGVIKFDAPVTSIGWYAFNECYGLTSITIPNSVTHIGYAAFEGCSSLTTVMIPEFIRSIGTNAFGLIPATSIIFNAINCTDIDSYGGGYDYTHGVFNPINFGG